MAEGKGVNVKMALDANGSHTWGTPETINTTGKAFRALNMSWEDVYEELPDESFNQDALRKETQLVGRHRVSGSFTVEMKYEGLEGILAAFMGTAGTPATHNVSYYKHTIYRKNDMTSVGATLGWDDGIKTHTVDSVKITGITLNGVMGQVLTADVTWMGRHRTEAGTGGLSSATEPTNIDRVLLTSSVVDYQIDTQGGGSLADFELNTWNVAMSRAYDDDDRAFSTTDAPHRRETMAGRFDCTGSFLVPYEATTYLTTAIAAGTTYGFKLRNVNTADVKEWGLWLPSLTFTTGVANPSDYGGIPLNLNFRCDLADATPTGFTQAAPYFEIINSASADPLA